MALFVAACNQQRTHQRRPLLQTRCNTRFTCTLIAGGTQRMRPGCEQGVGTCTHARRTAHLKLCRWRRQQVGPVGLLGAGAGRQRDLQRV